MALIYGLIRSSLSNHESPVITRQNKIISWKTSLYHSIRWGNFVGGIFVDQNQPYVKDDFFYLDREGDFMILMTGSVYNYNELADQLSLKNESPSLPELVGLVYRKYGKDFINYLNGDFSIFIYHPKNNESYLYRDHLGIRPLGYAQTDEGFYFSSDYMSLCKALEVNPKINPQFMLSIYGGVAYYNYKSLPNASVAKVLPGHYISITGTNSGQIKYWFPEKIKTNPNLSTEQIVNDLEQLLYDSISLRTDNRWMASAHVSGGFDSSLIALISRNKNPLQEPFYGFSWSPPNYDPSSNGVDERKAVQKVCSGSLIEPVFCDIDTDKMLRLYSYWRNYGRFVHENTIMSEAQARGVNLIYSGWGGDEFISINNRGIGFDLIIHFKWAKFLKLYPLQKPKRLLRNLLNQFLLPLFGLTQKFGNSLQINYKKYLNPIFAKEFSVKNQFKKNKSRRDFHLSFVNSYHIADRTEKWAINGYRHGIEYRYPLLDKRIIEYMIQVPSEALVEKPYYRIIINRLCRRIISEELTRQISKQEPVLQKKHTEDISALFDILTSKIEIYKENPDLNFINFDVLEKAINEYKRDRQNRNLKDIEPILVGINQLHGFTQGYHN